MLWMEKGMARKQNITAFFCENSAAKAAEPVANHRLLRGVNVITVPCAGSIEARRILHTLETGADKVLIVACPLDNCKYLSGNRRALKRAGAVSAALKQAGMDPSRVHMEWLSSVDTHKLLRVLEDMRC